VRTQSRDEPWWSRGHASVVEGPAGDWWIVYHGYENGFRTLGRQALLEPIEWTDDGWFRALGGDLSLPIAKPEGGRPSPSGVALSDDFTTNRLGMQWSFHNPRQDDTGRARYQADGFYIRGKGTSPADSSPLTCTVGERAYEVEVSLDLIGDAEGGLLLFYNEKAFVGLGFTPKTLKVFQYASEEQWQRSPHEATTLRIRITNDENVVTYHYSYDEGETWILHGHRMEVSGLNHNVFGQFVSLRVGIHAAGAGDVRVRDFRYRAL